MPPHRRGHRGWWPSKPVEAKQTTPSRTPTRDDLLRFRFRRSRYSKVSALTLGSFRTWRRQRPASCSTSTRGASWSAMPSPRPPSSHTCATQVSGQCSSSTSLSPKPTSLTNLRALTTRDGKPSFPALLCAERLLPRLTRASSLQHDTCRHHTGCLCLAHTYFSPTQPYHCPDLIVSYLQHLTFNLQPSPRDALRPILCGLRHSWTPPLFRYAAARSWAAVRAAAAPAR